MYNPAKEEYVYAVAGGETLQIIDYIEKQAETAEQELIDYVGTQGISAQIKRQNAYPEITYTLKDDTKPVPQGWEISETRAGKHLQPDFNNAAGDRIDREISKYWRKMNVQAQFNDLCHSLAPASHFNGRKYSYERLGNCIIVTSPKGYKGEAVIPNGSAPLGYLEYVTMQEQVNPSPAPQISRFQKRFQP
ncbi:MAG: hypothetical protein EA357_06810 [Micavibrio sp.]|nr:MAG: hypothetical protein EA357_06810 [Micavibrio sp.]